VGVHPQPDLGPRPNHGHPTSGTRSQSLPEPPPAGRCTRTTVTNLSHARPRPCLNHPPARGWSCSQTPPNFGGAVTLLSVTTQSRGCAPCSQSPPKTRGGASDLALPRARDTYSQSPPNLGVTVHSQSPPSLGVTVQPSLGDPQPRVTLSHHPTSGVQPSHLSKIASLTPVVLPGSRMTQRPTRNRVTRPLGLRGERQME
jgi:hypothetical protein